jgi:hypothetical protein
MTANAAYLEPARDQRIGTARIITEQRGTVESPVRPIKADSVIRAKSDFFINGLLQSGGYVHQIVTEVFAAVDDCGAYFINADLSP